MERGGGGGVKIINLRIAPDMIWFDIHMNIFAEILIRQDMSKIKANDSTIQWRPSNRTQKRLNNC